MDKKKNKTAKRKSPLLEDETLNIKSKKEKNTRKSVDSKVKTKGNNNTNNNTSIHEEIKENPQKIDTKSPKSKQTSSPSKSKSKSKDKNYSITENVKVVSDKKLSNKSNDLISIYSWNVNGLRAIINKGTLNEFVEKENPDILCLNETKIDEKNLKKLKLDELFKDKYTSYWNCSDKSGYAGVCVFTKVKPLNILNGIGIAKHDTEGRVITLEYESFYLVSVYIPNAGQGLTRLKYRTEEWDIDFKDFLENLRKKKNVILCGDLNVAHEEIDLKNPKGNKKTAGFTVEERKGFSNLLESGWIDTFRSLYPDKVQYSFWSARTKARESNNGWRLDYFIVNKEGKEKVLDSEILDSIMGSDHCPIKLKYKN